MSVCVLMSTFNGEKYINEQVESILEQTIDDLTLVIRDDFSNDKTKVILNKYKYPNVQIEEGKKNLGAAQSFMELLYHSPEADYYAFSDQDDIWDNNKLDIAIDMISKEETQRPTIPVLYHSRVKIADAKGNVIGENGTYEPRGFLRGEKRTVIGCTLVFNKILRNELLKYRPLTIAMHDSWVHDVCLSLDGSIIYDKQPHIRYRQHESNEVGGSKGIINAVKRRIKYYKKRKPGLNKTILTELLEGYGKQMKQEYVQRVKVLIEYDKSISNTFRVLKDPDYFRGRMWWKLEQVILILCRKY